ncbi:MAG: hypothetical protein IGR93_06980 [Hydrococcus sp. C42_A2020_068]|uniref:hypothetical protein n=1 Tax=Pleurocapsa sp. PCC 7327 TaxID=118163 RepID=UPI00029FF98E|nr:hypothetical protein [Pleurocapsa sp. PCC 7327]AFY78938.1 hypothetical protein Ple7327_3766 [Pleurocapsa sp. PCC 7327]MBF2019841.1 hypothetical protein [Hydrococcus sp. C42_A2020_068]
MSITITGTIARQDFGFGTWAIVTEAGETYELKDPPQELCQDRAKVKVEGRVRDDVMTVAMIGPVLEVSAFELLD